MIDCGSDFVIRAGPRGHLLRVVSASASGPVRAGGGLYLRSSTQERHRGLLPRRGHESGLPLARGLERLVAGGLAARRVLFSASASCLLDFLCDRRSSWAPLFDFRWARYPSRHRLSDPTGRASESEGYVRAGVYRCSSPENLISSSPAIRKRLQTFRFASTPPESRGGRLPRRCFLAWCTQFQITHVFLEAVPVLRTSNDSKTCESLLTSRFEPGAFTKTHRHRASTRHRSHASIPSADA